MNLITLDIGGTAIKTAYFNGDELLFQDTRPSNANLGGLNVIETIQQIIDEVKLQYPFEAIGISTAGQVDPHNGIILYANDNIPNYTGTKLKSILENIYHVPVSVENDVNAAAIGEFCYGAGKPYDDFLCLTYGTGIGGSIIINHRLYTGSSYVAAEMGHMITHPQGLACGCGSFGCYEQYASTTALVLRAKQHNPLWDNGKHIFDALNQHDAIAKEIVDSWIQEISYGLVNLIYIFNPPCIILGGGIMSQPYITEQLQQKIMTQTVTSFHPVTLLPAALGNLAGVYGMKAILEKKYRYE